MPWSYGIVHPIGMGIELQLGDAVFFDLDDTLADTFGTLVGPALQQAAAAMINAGLETDTATAATFMQRLAAHGAGADYFTDAVERFGPDGDQALGIAELGRCAYFTTDVSPIRLLPGARRLLEALAPRYRLFLVTAGDPQTQRHKVEQLAIGCFFHAVRLVSSIVHERKRNAFKELVADYALKPQHCVCVGDRLVGEIRDCNELGMTTIWMRRGEFRHLRPQEDHDQPNHTIVSFDELAALLGVDQTITGGKDARAS